MFKIAPQLRRALTVLALAVLATCPIVVVVAARLVYSVAYLDSDFFTFWLAGHMDWTGQNPYSSQQWVGEHQHFGANWLSDPIFPYPLPLATLLAPLGLLHVDQAFIAWVAVSIVLLVVTVFILLVRRPDPRLKHYVVPILAGLALFRPVWVILHNGQLGALLLFALVVCGLLLEEQRWFLGGLVGAVLAVKPTLGFPILGLVALWMLVGRRWRALAGLGAGLALLMGLGLVRDFNWIGEFLAIGQSKLDTTLGYSPTLWGMTGAVCSHDASCTAWLGGGLAGALAIGAAICVLIYGARSSPLQVLGMAVVVALLVTPYVWGYDQVLLLLPITLLVGELIRRGRVFLLNALAFLALDIGAILLLVLAFKSGEDVWSGLVPVLVGLALIWSAVAAAHKTALSMNSSVSSNNVA